MQSIEQTGRTVEEAVAAALKALGVERDQVEVEVLAQESRGLLGILGHTQAKVRVTVTPSGQAAAEPGPASDLAKHACDLIAEILRLMELEGAPEITAEEPDAVYINIHTEADLGLIIGRHGQTLAALQLLVAMIANRGLAPEARKKVILDVEGYRERRERALNAMARNAAERAKRTGRPVTIKSLNPRERRIVHLALANDSSVTTRSEGQDPDRAIIIAPRRGR